MYHLAAYYINAIINGALVQVDAVPDPAITVNGNDIRIPKDIANLLGVAGVSASTVPEYVQLQSPSLRQLGSQDSGPIASGTTFGADNQWDDMSMNPRALAAAESLSAYIKATDTLTKDNHALVFLGDGPVKPASGKIFTIRAGASAALALGKWVNTALTFDVVLPSGTYQIVGARIDGTGLIAGRFVFVGGGYRPGVLANVDDTTNRFPAFRHGNFGVLGQFDTDYPPTMDMYGSVGTGQAVFLDLIKSG